MSSTNEVTTNTSLKEKIISTVTFVASFVWCVGIITVGDHVFPSPYFEVMEVLASIGIFLFFTAVVLYVINIVLDVINILLTKVNSHLDQKLN